MQKPLAGVSLLALFLFSGCIGNNDSGSGVTQGDPLESVDHYVGNPGEVSDAVIKEQREKLAESAKKAEEEGIEVGPQSPRDIDNPDGSNHVDFPVAPPSTQMYLCDIHFHKSAEHKGGEFTRYAGNGDGEGYGTGYRYSGTLSEKELEKYTIENEENPLYSGDTIEVHYVYSSSPKATLGHGLGTCLDPDSDTQPLLRVESQVYVLVNDDNALDFTALNKVEKDDADRYQAVNIPKGPAVEYQGSTTGPGYNEKYSPYRVTWNVRKEVKRVDIESVEKWFESNEFNETHAHGVRNLVINPDLLSPIN